MTDDNKPGDNSSRLRTQAEKQLTAHQAGGASQAGEQDAKRLLHELQVHQVELEMQNEELRRALIEKNEHESHLRQIINLTPAGYFHLDLEGRFLDVNAAWLRMHGYDSAEEVIDQHYSIMQVDNESISAMAHMQELKKGVAIPAGEFVSKRKDGSIGQHIFSATPVVHFGEVTGFEWFIIDITEHKKLEADKQLLQQQFHQAQKLESLGVLAGGIAHDFNNILTVIISGCSLARLRPEKTPAQLDMIESAALRAAGLCSQMLAYAGKGKVVHAQVDIGKMILGIINMLRSTLKQNVTIKIAVDEDIPAIKADISQLSQLLMNLTINAAEAIDEKQGTIDVSLTTKNVLDDVDYLGKTIPAGCYACLSVSDNGCGMDEETRSRIFEPFYTTKFTGRGLGMSALIGIVSLHGGALQFTSQPGQGTTFNIYLPIMLSDADAPTTLLPPTTRIWKSSGTVLLVEDEEMVRAVAKMMLEEMGFSVIEACNGQEALNLYQQKTTGIDLVLTDIGMPVMDGYTLFSALKKINPTLPIIISSGFGDQEVTRRIAPEGIAGLISKPYLFSQLQALIKSVVEATPERTKNKS